MDKIKEIYASAAAIENKGCAIQGDKTYEVGLVTSDERIRRPTWWRGQMQNSGNYVEDTDSEHHILYSIDSPTPLFAFSVLKTTSLEKEGLNQRDVTRTFIRLRGRNEQLSFRFAERIAAKYMTAVEEKDDYEVYRSKDRQLVIELLRENIDNAVYRLFGLVLYPMTTLKISTDTVLSASFSELSASFLFVRSLAGYPIIQTATSLDDIVSVDRIHDARYRPKDLEPPRKNYKPELVDMYLAAEKTEDRYGSFLGYYHILEYFFDDVFKETIGRLLQTELTSPEFSYTNLDDVYSLGQEATKLIRSYKQGDAGNELKSLEYVLNKFIHENDIRSISESIINNLGRNSINRFTSHSPSFIKEAKISFSSPETFATTASRRIYRVRNSLVHSKSAALRYQGRHDSKEIKEELYFLKFVAEKVLINASEYLQ